METILPKSNRFWISVALIVATALTILIYWPGTHGGFVMDDFPNIVDNAAVHITNLHIHTLLAAAFSSHAGPLDRPLSMVSFAINEYFWGPAPYSMKVTNVVLHACNGLLVYAVVALILTAYRRRFAPELGTATIYWTAVATAAAWLLLPINLTAVLYVVQRMTSLSGTFALASITFYLWGRLRMLDGKPGLWMLWTGIATFGVLAVLAKEVGALLPVYTLILEWILFGFERADGRRDRRLYGLYAALLVLPGILGLIWVAPSQLAHNAYAARPFTLGERLLTEPRVFLDYIVWSLAPNLHVLSLYHDDYPFSHSLTDPLSTLPAIIGVALLLAIAVWQRRRRPLLSLGLLWFFGGQLLTGTVFNLELVYEHRNYLPSIGLLIAAFSIILLEHPRQRMTLARRFLVAGLITLYAGITAVRVHQWANPVDYAAIAAAEHPKSPRATYALGRIYAVLVNSPKSRFLPLADAALEKAAAVPNSGILPETGLLLINAKQHMRLNPAWWTTMTHKLATRPASSQDITALYSLVQCELKHLCVFSDYDMTRILSTAAARNPEDPKILAIFSNFALNVQRNYSLARHLMVQTTRIAPKTGQYWIDLIKMDIFLSRYGTAHHEIEHLRQLDRFGSLNEAIQKLRRRLARAQAARQAVSGTPSPAPDGGRKRQRPNHRPSRISAQQ